MWENGLCLDQPPPIFRRMFRAPSPRLKSCPMLGIDRGSKERQAVDEKKCMKSYS